MIPEFQDGGVPRPISNHDARRRHSVRNARPAPKTESLVSADVVQLALRSRFNPLRGLTPQLLSVYLDNFMLGFVAYAALVWDQIEKRDDVIRNVASKRKKAVAKFKRQSFQKEEPGGSAHAEALDEFYDNMTVSTPSIRTRPAACPSSSAR